MRPNAKKITVSQDKLCWKMESVNHVLNIIYLPLIEDNVSNLSVQSSGLFLKMAFVMNANHFKDPQKTV